MTMQLTKRAHNTNYSFQALLVAASLMCTHAYADNWTPTNLVASGTTANSVSLGWTPPVDTNGVTGYKVLSMSGELLGSPTSNSFSVTGLNAATTYNFMVVACYVNIGCEAQGPTQTVTTLAAAPVAVAPVIPAVNIQLPGLSDKATVKTSVTGPVEKQTILLTNKVPDTEGRPLAMYVAAVWQSNVFFLNSSGVWSLYDPKIKVKAFSTFGTTSGSKEISITLATEADFSAVIGTAIIVGYGRGVEGLSDPFEDMLTNLTYEIVYTIK